MVSFTVNVKPVPINRTYGAYRGRVYTKPEAKEWRYIFELFAKLAMKGKQLIKGKLSVELIFSYKDNRRHDIDGGIKSVLDACQGIIYENDFQVNELYVKRFLGTKDSIEVNVKPYVEG